jgi:hypothetical protein
MFSLLDKSAKLASVLGTVGRGAAGAYDVIGSGTAGMADAIRRLSAAGSATGQASGVANTAAGLVRAAPWLAGGALAAKGVNDVAGDPVGREIEFQKEQMRQRLAQTRAVWDPDRGMML